MAEEALLQENKMGVLPVNRLLLSMSLPMMVSMLIQALYNIVDSIFVAQIGENALTAVSLAFPVQNLMIAIGAGTGVGINALLSRSLGEKNYDEANNAANNGVFLAVVSALVFLVAGLVLIRPYFMSQTDIQEIVDYGCSYTSICLIFSIGIFGQITLERLLQSTGKTIYSMASQITGAVINIILDPIMIFGLLGFPEMGVSGAALATVIGQLSGMFLGLWLNISKNHEIQLRVKGFRPRLATIKRIYMVGVPSIIMMSIGSVMVYGLNRILLAFSSTAAAVLGVYFKLQSFVFMPVFGLNNGMIPIVAYNYGAQRSDRIKQTMRLSIVYAIVIMAAGLIIFQIFPQQLLAMFNASEDMSRIGVTALRTISLSYVGAGFCIVSSSVFQALGNGFLSLVMSVVRQLVVLLPAAYLLSRLGNLDLVWWAFVIAECTAMVITVFSLRYVFRTIINAVPEPRGS